MVLSGSAQNVRMHSDPHQSYVIYILIDIFCLYYYTLSVFLDFCLFFLLLHFLSSTPHQRLAENACILQLPPSLSLPSAYIRYTHFAFAAHTTTAVLYLVCALCTYTII